MAGLTLGELMGKQGGQQSKERKLTLEDLPSLLGDGMPEISRSPVGRIRLLRALKQRFGAGFKSIPGIVGIIKDFDKEVDFEIAIVKMKRIKGKEA